MNNDEAKFILQAYRPNGLDATDVIFTAALEHARRDPLLGAWFTREQAYDKVVADKLREIIPPTDLRDRIMAGGRVSRKTRITPRKFVNWLALAASVAIIFALSDFWQERRVEAAQVAYAQFALDDMQNGHHLPAKGEFLGNTLLLLAQSTTRLPGKLALNMDEMKANGCRTVKYAGRDAVEICFSRDGIWYHLYVTPRGTLPRRLLGDSSSLLAVNESGAAVWSDGDFDFAMVSPKGMSALRLLVG